MFLYNLTRSYILYVAKFMFQIYVLDRQTDRQTEKQVAFIGRDYSRKYLRMRLMVGEAEGV